MSEISQAGRFLAELMAVLEKNIANEQFGVSELANEMNMSRSNLLRKVKKESDLSVSQLINQVRLNRAKKLLQTTSLNVSEVAHEVGFNSPSYFIKCFREYYGYPPGETGKHDIPPSTAEAELPATPEGKPASSGRRSARVWVAASISLLIVVTVAFLVWSRASSSDRENEKSIAVLPFKNDSNDSTNVYVINGLMESTLNKLHQIGDLRVISRTSVEKYRNLTKTIPEMSEELNVKYFVEGSGQKIGDNIVLNIQLIDAPADKHIWSKQYRRETRDIFQLQEDIARDITKEIEIVISPEENRRITRKPTNDPVAYDYYLKGKDLFYKSGPKDLLESVPWFRKAVERDPEFSLAYATSAMVHYYLDLFNLEKKYTDEIDNLAEKAILYDARSSESMVAKALSFAQKKRYELSIPYFEKALEFDPRSGLVLHFLTEFYNIHVPNPPKYLEYAILKTKIDHATDSHTASFNHFHLSNALLQNGFLEQALEHSNRSLQLDPKSFFGGYVNDYIHYALDGDARKAKDRLYLRWKKDTTRFDILQEVGKMHFICRDYPAAASCYDRSLVVMGMVGLDIFTHEYLRIAMAYKNTGQYEKANEYARRFKDFADHNLTMYKDLHLACYYAYQNETTQAIDHLRKFAKEQDNFLYWILLMRTDPMSENLRQHPEFDVIMKEIENKFWSSHNEVKRRLRVDELHVDG